MATTYTPRPGLIPCRPSEQATSAIPAAARDAAERVARSGGAKVQRSPPRGLGSRCDGSRSGRLGAPWR